MIEPAETSAAHLARPLLADGSSARVARRPVRAAAWVNLWLVGVTIWRQGGGEDVGDEGSNDQEQEEVRQHRHPHRRRWQHAGDRLGRGAGLGGRACVADPQKAAAGGVGGPSSVLGGGSADRRSLKNQSRLGNSS